MHVCPKINSISAEVLYQAVTDTKNRHHKHITPLHVYVVRQNGRRKSNLDAFVAAQERSIAVPTNSAIGPSPAEASGNIKESHNLHTP